MLKRSLYIQFFALYVKNVPSYLKKTWDPLRDLRETYGMRSPLKVATHGRHSMSPLNVATQGGHCMLKRSIDIQRFALYVKKRSLVIKKKTGIP
jgi:hypothetical protein